MSKVNPLGGAKAGKVDKSPGLDLMEAFKKLKPEERKALGEAEQKRAIEQQKAANKGWGR